MKQAVLLLCAVVCVCTAGFADDQAKVVPAAELKYANVPGLPACLKVAVADGAPDSDKGGVFVLKGPAGCVVPWHWHTPAEQLGIVSGTFKLEMKGGATKSLTAGSYVDMPGKHSHQATCTTACTVFLATRGKFDIHYVDASDKEISADEALKTKGAKAAPKKAAPKQ